MDVSSNSLVGTIPTEIGLMSSLQSIQLQNNFISGLFPTEMARLDPNLALNLTGNLYVTFVIFYYLMYILLALFLVLFIYF